MAKKSKFRLWYEIKILPPLQLFISYESLNFDSYSPNFKKELVNKPKIFRTNEVSLTHFKKNRAIDSAKSRIDKCAIKTFCA